jgi:transcription initiation factor IIE alpha subunit
MMTFFFFLPSHLPLYLLLLNLLSFLQTTASHLVRRGRATVQVLVRSTGLRAKQVRDALFILLNQQLATYAETPQTLHSNPNAAAYYEMRVDRALSIARYPRVVHVVREMHGVECALLVRHILQSGMCTEEQLASAMDVYGHATKQAELHERVRQLVEARILQRVLPRHMQTHADRRLNAEDRARDAQSATQFVETKKQKRPASVNTVADGAAANNVLSGSKRKRVFEEDVNEEPSSSAFKANSGYLRVDMDVVDAHMRNACIVDFVRIRLNESASRIVRIMLEQYRPFLCGGEETLSRGITCCHLY